MQLQLLDTRDVACVSTGLTGLERSQWLAASTNTVAATQQHFMEPMAFHIGPRSNVALQIGLPKILGSPGGAGRHEYRGRWRGRCIEIDK